MSRVVELILLAAESWAIIQHKAEQGSLTLRDLLVETGTLKQWSLIADNLPGRTNKDCRKRWAKLGNEVKRGTWSSDEDEKLQSAIAQVGFKYDTTLFSSRTSQVFHAHGLIGGRK